MYRTNVLNHFPSLIIDHTCTETKIFEHTSTPLPIPFLFFLFLKHVRNDCEQLRTVYKIRCEDMPQGAEEGGLFSVNLNKQSSYLVI